MRCKNFSAQLFFCIRPAKNVFCELIGLLLKRKRNYENSYKIRFNFLFSNDASGEYSLALQFYAAQFVDWREAQGLG